MTAASLTLRRYAPMWPVLSWALFAVGALYCVTALLGLTPDYQSGPRGALGVMVDAEAYYTAPPHDPYVNSTPGAQGAYLYSPAFVQAVAPLRLLPEPLFVAVWTALHLAAIAYLGPWLAVLPPVIDDVVRGNVNTFLALSMVVAVRYPAAWSFAVLTKVVPGVGAAWHLYRREWRAVLVATATTLAVVLTSVAIGGAATWDAWIEMLLGLNGGGLWWRLPLALALVGLAAWRWRWLLPVGVLAMFGTPALSTFALLAAIPRLRR